MSITSANAVIILTVPGVFSSGVKLQGFSTDDVEDWEQVKSVETAQGIDGNLSAGYVNAPRKQTISLQADSASNDVFEAWGSAMDAAQEVIQASASIAIPGISKAYSCTVGWLVDRSPSPSAKKTLQPRKWGIEWQTVAPTPI